VYERARLVVEIDGAGHMDVEQYWDDMNRDRELTLAGYTVLRFPAFMVRHRPEQVAAQIRKALNAAC
jgi:very-short-patch-repair endonuclease